MGGGRRGVWCGGEKSGSVVWEVGGEVVVWCGVGGGRRDVWYGGGRWEGWECGALALHLIVYTTSSV